MAYFKPTPASGIATCLLCALAAWPSSAQDAETPLQTDNADMEESQGSDDPLIAQAAERREEAVRPEEPKSSANSVPTDENNDKLRANETDIKNPSEIVSNSKPSVQDDAASGNPTVSSDRESSATEIPSDSQNEPPASFETCISAIETAERIARDLPSGLLLAIAETESGRSLSGEFGPWPWTLNIDGEGLYFDSRASALSAAETALDTGEGNVDLGCMQISETWHGWAFDGLEDMINPLENAGYAASFLMTLHATHGNWRDAIAHYHSGNPARGFAYTKRVLDNWRRNPAAEDFIINDESLTDVDRLAENLSDIREIEAIAEEYFLSVKVSEEYEISTAFAAKDENGRLYVSLNDLAEVPFKDRFSLPLVTYGESVLIDLSDTRFFEAQLDEENYQLEIIAKGDLFPEQVSQAQDVINPEDISERAPGAHLNYSIATSMGSNGTQNLSTALQAIGYWDNKTLRSSFLVQDDLTWKRLSTSLTIDNYENQRTIVLGDTVTPAASGWGTRTPIFGITWGTNGRLDPSFSTLPDYSVFGVTDIPAVAQFIVDGEPVRETTLKPGPFEFSDLPFPDAYGDLTVSVEDVQGQVQYFKVPYIRIPQLYKKGLHTFDYGLGFEKVSSDNSFGEYGSIVGSATHRYGFTDTFTGEIHGQISPGSLAFGVTGDFAFLQNNWFLSTNFATSFSDLGAGFQAGLSFGGIQKSQPSWFSGSLRFNSEDFYLGNETLADTERRDSARWSLRLTSSLRGLLPFTVNYSFNDTWGDTSTHAISAGRSWSLKNGWNLNLSGDYRDGSEGTNTRLFLSISKSFGEKNAMRGSLNHSISDGSHYTTANLQRPKRTGKGIGYYARISGDPASEGFKNATLGLEGESNRFNYSATASLDKDQYSVDASVSGAIALLDGETFSSVRISCW